jgi:hypothetical protein
MSSAPATVPTPDAVARAMAVFDASAASNDRGADISRIRHALTGAIDLASVKPNEPEAAPADDNTETLADPSSLSIEELSKIIGAQRSVRMRRELEELQAARMKKIEEVPRSGPVQVSTRLTRSREPQWCKVAEDGFTPLRKQPAMTITTVYDTATGVPARRTWTVLDPFSRENRITDVFSIDYPSAELEWVARDLTQAWQAYQARDLKSIDFTLLANTPLHVEVDNIRVARYSDLWCHLKRVRGDLPASAKWRVVRGQITSK